MSNLASDSPDMPAYLGRLNDAQRLAVEHGDGSVAGPLLIIAGAGSGKTNTLAHRVAHLIVHGADPRRILLLTFSRRAAAEMTRRVERIAGEVLRRPRGGADRRPDLGRHLPRHRRPAAARACAGRSASTPPSPSTTARTPPTSSTSSATSSGLSRTESRFPAKGTCLAIYSRAVNAQAPLADGARRPFPWCAGWEDELKALFAAYVEAKQAPDVLDYDDLLLYWAHDAAEPAIAAELGQRFDHVLVDEYQDTNRLQAAILLRSKPDGRGLTVVGDDAQSIYAFRAADGAQHPRLPQPVRDRRPSVVTLEQNYRSTQPILAAANAVIGAARERFTKNLWTERRSAARPALVTVRDEAGQADYVVRPRCWRSARPASR